MIDIMLKLSETTWVNALDVTEVRLNDDRNVIVTLRNGRVLMADPDYKQSVFELHKRVLSHINEAARIYSGKVEHGEPQFKPAGEGT